MLAPEVRPMAARAALARVSSLPLVALAAVAPFAGCAGRDAPAATGPLPPEAAVEMVQLPGGRYLAGEPTGPRLDVVTYNSVRPFLLDVTEVTVAAYAACVRAGGCRPAATKVEMDGMRKPEEKTWSAYCNGDRADRADHPVNCVDWKQAADYCAWAGKRLPSEEEWEWAGRNAGEGTAYPWGDDPPDDRACWNGDGNGAGTGKRAVTCRVGSHPTGDAASGAKDLTGNVSEWTSSDAVVRADSFGRQGYPVKVVRGGGWTTRDPAHLTVVRRFLELPSRRSPDLGFRCAKRQ
jgi:formylglycine-generating enzyme required for sulfatase activity